MTGAELYTTIDLASIPGDPEAAEKLKTKKIEILQDALDAAWEAGLKAGEQWVAP